MSELFVSQSSKILSIGLSFVFGFCVFLYHDLRAHEKCNAEDIREIENKVEEVNNYSRSSTESAKIILAEIQRDILYIRKSIDDLNKK